MFICIFLANQSLKTLFMLNPNTGFADLGTQGLSI